jgi:hypothetical protein
MGFSRCYTHSTPAAIWLYSGTFGHLLRTPFF